MNEQQRHIPIYKEVTETPEEQEKKQRLKTIFADLESKQPDFLDEAAKSIIERVATFLAILFGVIALGGSFPPKFLVSQPWEKYLIIGILLCYLLAMAFGMWAIHPRNYARYLYDMTQQEREWQRLITRKKRCVRWAGILFGVGTVVLALLVVFIIWPF
jgi:hypothetical protein